MSISFAQSSRTASLRPLAPVLCLYPPDTEIITTAVQITSPSPLGLHHRSGRARAPTRGSFPLAFPTHAIITVRQSAGHRPFSRPVQRANHHRPPLRGSGPALDFSHAPSPFCRSTDMTVSASGIVDADRKLPLCGSGPAPTLSSGPPDSCRSTAYDEPGFRRDPGPTPELYM